jgi:thiosulfate dehydrogenase
MEMVKKYRLLILVMSSMIISVMTLVIIACQRKEGGKQEQQADKKEAVYWQPPFIKELPATPEADMIRYGRDLIANTAVYFGPKGTVGQFTNGMNCQNCHLEAGTKFLGNNYSGVYSTYPLFRHRSGTMENIYKRVNDCIERSLNGKHGIDTSSREMQAIYAYIKWLGQKVPKSVRPVGAGIKELSYPDRAADPENGKRVYIQSCQRCHGKNGEGVLQDDGIKYTYPPLWGNNSYTTAAGLYRLSRFAGFVQQNMPFDIAINSAATALTDEESWDVAAFVNSQPRPVKTYKQDWPDISGKPIDHPFGPYADSFPEQQHKYGPFKPIKEAKEKIKGSKP